MKIVLSKLLLVFFLAGILIAGCKRVEKKAEDTTKEIIRVGVFDKNGDSPYCITDAMEALRIDPKIECKVVSASEIVSGALDHYDVILFPGGGGRSETGSLGEIGIEKVQKMVQEQGKGVVGICAGAYILSNTPDYPCLAMSGGEAIDIEHDHRGHGLAKFTLTAEGEEIFPELKGRKLSFCQYYEGPVLVPAKGDIKYTSLATMESDVHTVAGTPANMTNNRPFIILSEAGKGKTASFVGHPECTPGMRWMVPRLVRWVANKELVKYGSNVVRPDFYKNEIIFTKEVSDLQSKYYSQLTGTKEERLESIEKVVTMACWSAKKWVPGMLRDKDPEIRMAAAKGVVLLERTDAIPDLVAAVQIETNQQCKAELQRNLKLLKAMIGSK
ncbi:MAG: hypothetical protein ACEPOZ_19180 [Marinifilaceae bacterium]